MCCCSHLFAKMLLAALLLPSGWVSKWTCIFLLHMCEHMGVNFDRGAHFQAILHTPHIQHQFRQEWDTMKSSRGENKIACVRERERERESNINNLSAVQYPRYESKSSCTDTQILTIIKCGVIHLSDSCDRNVKCRIKVGNFTVSCFCNCKFPIWSLKIFFKFFSDCNNNNSYAILWLQ